MEGKNLKKDIEIHCVALQESIRCGYIDIRTNTKLTENISKVFSQRVYLKEDYTDKDLKIFMELCDIEYGSDNSVFDITIWFKSGGWGQLFHEYNGFGKRIMFHHQPKIPMEILSFKD